MGKVFSFQEIVDRKIPHPESFLEVRNYNRETLSNCDAVYGAVEYGSVQSLQFTERSDMDLLVVYFRAQQAAARNALRDIQSYASNRFVPMIPDFFSCEDARASLHTVDLSFLTHLRLVTQNGGWIRENPVNCLKFAREATEVCRMWFPNTVMELEQASMRTNIKDDLFYWSLRTALKAPVHAARRALTWIDGPLSHDDKQTVVRLYTEKMGRPMALPLHQVLAVDAEYTRVVKEQVANPNQSEYEQMIETLVGVIPVSIEFIRSTALLINGVPFAAPTS